MTEAEYCNALDYQRLATAIKLIADVSLAGIEDRRDSLLKRQVIAVGFLQEMRDELHGRIEVEEGDDGK